MQLGGLVHVPRLDHDGLLRNRRLQPPARKNTLNTQRTAARIMTSPPFVDPPSLRSSLADLDANDLFEHLYGGDLVELSEALRQGSGLKLRHRGQAEQRNAQAPACR
jgi:hypothetical protein